MMRPNKALQATRGYVAFFHAGLLFLSRSIYGAGVVRRA